MIDKAILFATKAHYNVTRKGTKIPYILHPLEAASIVSKITEDKDLIVAAILHDTIEDTYVSYEDIAREFGKKIADIVNLESEDKTKTWKERKEYTLKTLKNEPIEIKIVAMGDKLSNMRDIAKDYYKVGDKLWERFHVKDKQMHAWYYKGLLDCLSDLKNTLQ